MLSNTFFWLENKIEKEQFQVKSSQLRQLYEKAIKLKIPLIELPFPERTSLDNEEYRLKRITKDTQLFLIQSSWNEFAELVNKHIENVEGVLVDGIIPVESLSDFEDDLNSESGNDS